MRVKHFSHANRPTVLANESPRDVELVASVDRQDDRNVAVGAIEFDVRGSVGDHIALTVGTAEGPDGLEPQAEAAATARRYRGRVSRDGRVMIDFGSPVCAISALFEPVRPLARTNRRHGKTVEARCGSSAPGTVHSFNACADQ